MIFHEQLYLRTKSSDNSVFNGKKITLLKFFLKKCYQHNRGVQIGFGNFAFPCYM